MRLHQELVLGVGGVRALRALDLAPAVWHLNEGHSAFLLAERARELVARRAPPSTTRWIEVRRNTVFTIHTPVSAGNERFDVELVRRVAGPLLDGDGRPGHGRRAGRARPRARPRRRGRPGAVRHDRLLAAPDPRRQRRVASSTGTPPTPPGRESRPHEILGLTNGVHTPTWVGQPMRDALERHTDADLDDHGRRAGRSRFWERLGELPDGRALGGAPAPEAGAGDLRARTPAQPVRAPRRGTGELEELEASSTRGSSPSASRAGSPPTSAHRCCSPTSTAWPGSCWDAERPLQIVFAGKAHPADRPGQGVIQDIFGRSREPQAPGPGVHPRGLRHPHRPLPGPGRRRLAQQPAPAARGVGHVRA